MSMQVRVETISSTLVLETLDVPNENFAVINRDGYARVYEMELSMRAWSVDILQALQNAAVDGELYVTVTKELEHCCEIATATVFKVTPNIITEKHFNLRWEVLDGEVRVSNA